MKKGNEGHESETISAKGAADEAGPSVSPLMPEGILCASSSAN